VRYRRGNREDLTRPAWGSLGRRRPVNVRFEEVRWEAGTRPHMDGDGRGD
jgi:hypothetical protein